MKYLVRHVCLSIWLALVMAPGIAAHYVPRLTQLEHRLWREQDSGVRGANGIVQTTDGFLWIATDAGLMRFDGVRFVAKNQFGGTSIALWQITALLAGADGSLWLGAPGHVLQIKGDSVEDFPVQGRPSQLVEDRHGALWIALTRPTDSHGPVCAIANRAVRCYGKPEIRFPLAGGLTPEPDGAFWIQSDEGLCHWKPGTQDECFLHEMLRSAQGLAGIQATVRSRAGELWVGITDTGGHPYGLGRFVDGAWAPFMAPGFDGSKVDVCCIAEDAGGALWVGAYAGGIYRIRGNEVEHFDRGDGLTSNHVLDIDIDAEGTVWVTTKGGIDAFRAVPVTTFSVREGMSESYVSSVLAGKDGTVWTGTQPLGAFRAGRKIPVALAGAPLREQTMAMLEDHRGNLWFGQGGKLYVKEGTRRTEVRDAAGHATGAITEMIEDGAGDIWAYSAQGSRILRIHDRVAADQRFAKGLRGFDADPHGSAIWTVWRDGIVRKHVDGKFEAIPPVGIDLGLPNDIWVDLDGVAFVATQRALAIYHQSHWKLLDIPHGLPCEGVRSMLRDAHGDLWVLMQCGHMRIDAAELRRWLVAPRTVARSRLLTDTDGFEAGGAGARPRMSAAPDGKLWFATEKSIQMVDPAHLPPLRAAPKILIDALTADRRAYSLAQRVTLPSGTRDVGIAYAAPSSIAASKIRFRYRLDGRDAIWHDVGDRREAFYTDLGPGQYRFRVTAANSDGVWNETGTSLDFAITPPTTRRHGSGRCAWRCWPSRCTPCTCGA